MNLKTVPFEVKAVGARKGEESFLITREIGRNTKEAICNKLSEIESDTVLELDFSSIRFMDISCADEVVVKPLARIEAQEFPDRFIVLSYVGAQHKENIESALNVSKKAVVVKENESYVLMGKLVNNYRDALWVPTRFV